MHIICIHNYVYHMYIELCCSTFLLSDSRSQSTQQGSLFYFTLAGS